eukprot:CAMPEP_0174326082 /NCGR_PEP_ID=MMETSP0810-20121108/13680_1 /TAXON_ID=73025 ORGANISM="Eutreptiella gymnastica-like, Strain CCMP1594" /NCGR_SAMPLE_ID=MMETSP0810 /ASSEMBLY_ACC=CAM_ASM_000659 /LENGTH=50 /DNA_ID=CAMNT_0015439611 /DNA_START=189 /DNA_END=341 /DNA_ORIENTATION=-
MTKLAIRGLLETKQKQRDPGGQDAKTNAKWPSARPVIVSADSVSNPNGYT